MKDETFNYTFIKRAGLPREMLLRIAKDLGIAPHNIRGENYFKVMQEASRRSAIARAARKAKQMQQEALKEISKNQTPITPKIIEQSTTPKGPVQLELF